MAKATRAAALDPLDLHSRTIDVIVLYDRDVFERLEEVVKGARADQAQVWQDHWEQRQLQVSPAAPQRPCLVFCPRPHDERTDKSPWLHPKDSLEKLLDSWLSSVSPGPPP